MTRFNLPEVQFAEKSARQIEIDIVNRYEAATGKRLSDADPIRIFIKALVPIIAQQRSNIDFSAKQNLLAYSTGDYLDHLGAFSQTKRSEPAYATTTERFHLTSPVQKTIPAGTRVTAGDGVFFEVIEDTPTDINKSYIDVKVQCTQGGDVGNGYLPGEIDKLIEPIYWVESVENITESSGGADWESDDSYALKIQQAPESFSTAGPEQAYEYWAKKASSEIIDVKAFSPSPGVARIVPLLKNGEVAGQEILDKVSEACSKKNRRPLTDFVEAVAHEQVHYDIEFTYYIRKEDSIIASDIQKAVQDVVDEYRAWQKAKLGRAIDPTELIYLVKKVGAKRLKVVSPSYQELSFHQAAMDVNVSITYGGIE